MKLGLVGVGNIGLAVAGQLVSVGYTLRVHDVSASAVEHAVALGANAASLSDILHSSDIVLLSLPTPEIAASVGSELIEQGRAGLVVVDLSTNDPQTARRLYEAASARAVAYVDAPVSGGPSRARTGELTMMAGGDETVIERIRPVLADIAKQVEYAGGPGSGAIAKLLNNFIAIWGMIGVSQAFLAASALGASQQRIYEIMAKSSARSYALDRNFPKIRDGNYKPDFSIELGEKDMRLAVQLMHDAGFNAFAQDEIRELFARAGEDGGNNRDLASMHLALSAMLSRGH